MSAQDENRYQNGVLVKDDPLVMPVKELYNYYHCPACKVPFTEHLGLVGTCKLKLEAEKDKDISIQDWCEMDTEIKAITSKFGIPDYYPVQGYGFKSAETCVEELAERHNAALEQIGLAGAEIARLRSALEVDNLAGIIRFVDGNHSLGAGQLAEAIIEALSLSAPAEPSEDDKEAAQLQSLLVSKFPTFRPSYPSGLFAWATAALSAPAGQDNSQKQYYLPPDTRKAGVSALAEGEWREFRPSQSNPIQMGDQYRPKPELAISWQQGWSDIEGWIGMTQASENLIYRRLRPATKEE